MIASLKYVEMEELILFQTILIILVHIQFKKISEFHPLIPILIFPSRF